MSRPVKDDEYALREQQLIEYNEVNKIKQWIDKPSEITSLYLTEEGLPKMHSLHKTLEPIITSLQTADVTKDPLAPKRLNAIVSVYNSFSTKAFSLNFRRSSNDIIDMVEGIISCIHNSILSILNTNSEEELSTSFTQYLLAITVSYNKMLSKYVYDSVEDMGSGTAESKLISFGKIEDIKLEKVIEALLCDYSESLEKLFSLEKAIRRSDTIADETRRCHSRREDRRSYNRHNSSQHVCNNNDSRYPDSRRSERGNSYFEITLEEFNKLTKVVPNVGEKSLVLRFIRSDDSDLHLSFIGTQNVSKI